MDASEETPEHLIQATYTEEGWSIDFGPELEKYDDDTKLVLAGKLFNSLGIRLLSSTVNDLENTDDTDEEG